MNYKHPGIQKVTKKICAERNAIMVGLKIPKKKRTGNIGMKYNREEDRVRPIIIKALRKDGWKIRRVEPCTSGDFSLGDVWMEHHGMKMAGWGEIKSSTGRLSLGQKNFQRGCSLYDVNYWVLRPLGDTGYTMERT